MKMGSYTDNHPQVMTLKTKKLKNALRNNREEELFKTRGLPNEKLFPVGLKCNVNISKRNSHMCILVKYSQTWSAYLEVLGNV